MIAINHGAALLQDVMENAQPVETSDASKCFISSADFAGLNLNHEWLVKGVMEREEIIESVKANNFEVLILDPMYLGLLADNPHANAGNVLKMGPVLQHGHRTKMLAKQ